MKTCYGGFAYGASSDSGEFAYPALNSGSGPPLGDLFALKTIYQTPGYVEKGICAGLILQSGGERAAHFSTRGAICAFVPYEDHLDEFDNIPPRPIMLA